MALLIGDDIAAVGRAPLGALMILAAALAWAIGTVATKGFQWTVSLTAMVGWQLLASSIPMLAAAYLFESDRWVVPSLWLSRTRFPWTQNWLNRSVQGGPEHDR